MTFVGSAGHCRAQSAWCALYCTLHTTVLVCIPSLGLLYPSRVRFEVQTLPCVQTLNADTVPETFYLQQALSCEMPFRVRFRNKCRQGSDTCAADADIIETNLVLYKLFTLPGTDLLFASKMQRDIWCASTMHSAMKALLH